MSFINPRAKVFRHLDRLAAWDRGETVAPVTIEWDLSNRCSLGCQACHFAHTHSRGPWATKGARLPMAFDATGDLADTALVERALLELASMPIGRPLGIVWSGGGEPTLHPEWLRTMRYAKALRFEQGLYTLGGHLSPADARELARVVAFVVVSLDAVDAETYAREKGVAPARFRAACDGIAHLSGHEAAIGVSYLLHAGNWHQAPAMVALSRQLGATYSTFRPAVHFAADAPSQPTDDRGWITNALPTLAHVSGLPDVEMDLRRFTDYRDWAGHGYTQCRGVRLNTTITPDGRVWLCPNRRGVAGSCLGDLRTESFAALWARHPGHYAVEAGCRVMCRLHAVNQTLESLAAPQAHEAFV